MTSVFLNRSNTEVVFGFSLDELPVQYLNPQD